MQIANSNLQDSHARLSQMVGSHPSYSGVPTTTTTASATTSTSSVSFTSPSMGTGYSSSLLFPRVVSQLPEQPSPFPHVSVSPAPGHVPSLPPPHVTGPSGGVALPSSLAGAAAGHAQRNNIYVGAAPSSVAGYSGPTIPELRGDPETNGLAQRMMSLLLREIPALSAPPSAPSQPAQSGAPPPPVFNSHHAAQGSGVLIKSASSDSDSTPGYQNLYDSDSDSTPTPLI